MAQEYYDPNFDAQGIYNERDLNFDGIGGTPYVPISPPQGIQPIGYAGQPVGSRASTTTTVEEDDDAIGDGKVYYDLYQMESRAPVLPDNQRLQDIYGTGAMPVFEWVRSIVSGQGSYDPNDPADEARRREYENLTKGSSLPTFMELYGSTIGDLAGKAVGSSLAGAIFDPYVGGSAPEVLSAAGQDILPDSLFNYKVGTPLPSTQLANITDQAMQATDAYSPSFMENISQKFGGKAPVKLSQLNAATGSDYTVFPELANAEVAKITGNSGVYDQLDTLKKGTKTLGDTNIKVYDANNPEVANKLDYLNFDASKVDPGTALAQPGTAAYAAGTDLGTGVNYPAGYGAAVPSTPTFADMSYVDDLGGTFMDDVAISPSVSGGITSSTVASPVGYFENAGNTLTSGSVWASAGIGAVVNFGIGVLSGQDPVKAATQAGASAVGAVIGQALIPIPFVGGMIGSAIGGMVGGRVICNELVRQGLMDRRNVILDYKFTKDHLTTQHVLGYHVWAVHVVKRLRKGKNVRVWKHLASHRANEIAFIYGERDKPDYLGKVYRRIGEPICWAIGAFCKKTDWSVLYNPKEI